MCRALEKTNVEMMSGFQTGQLRRGEISISQTLRIGLLVMIVQIVVLLVVTLIVGLVLCGQTVGQEHTLLSNKCYGHVMRS